MRDSFIFYRSFLEAANHLDASQKAELIIGICEYAINNKRVQMSAISSAMFSLIQPQIDANQRRYENGKKGWRPALHNNEKPNHNQNITKAKANVNDNVNVNDNENEIYTPSKKNDDDKWFEKFWLLYNKKINKTKTWKKRLKLSQKDRDKIMDTLPTYISTIKDKQYQKHPMTYLNNRCWEDEIIWANTKTIYNDLYEFNKQVRDNAENVKSMFSSKYGGLTEYNLMKEKWRNSDLFLKS